MKGKIKVYVKRPADTEAAFVRLSPVKSYSPSEESVDTSERSFLDQDSDYKDHTPGMIDPGEVSIGVEYDKTNAGQTLVEAELGAVVDVKVEFLDGDSELFSATVTKRAWSEPNRAEDLMRNYSFKLKGEVTKVPAP